MNQSEAIQPMSKNDGPMTIFHSARLRAWVRPWRIVIIGVACLGLWLLPQCWRSFCVSQIQIATADRRWEDASSWITRLRWLNSQSSQAMLCQARIFRKQGDALNAREWLRQADLGGHSREELRHEEWLIEAQWGNLSAVEEPLLSALQQERDIPEILDALVQGYLRSGQYSKAQVTLDTWRTMNSRAARPFVWQGILWMQLSDWDKASAAFREAMRLQPNDAETELLLAETLLANKQVDDAALLFRKCVKSLSAREAVLVGLARALIIQGHSDDAVNLLEPMRNNDRHSTEFGLAFGEALLNCDRSQEAVHVLQAAMDHNGRNIELQHLFGTALRLVGRTADAEKYLTHARQARQSLQTADRLRKLVLESPKANEEKLQLAKILLENDRDAEATTWLRSLLADQPQHSEALRLLANHSRHDARTVVRPYAFVGGRQNGDSILELSIAKSIPHSVITVDAKNLWELNEVSSDAGIVFSYRNGCESGHATVVETLGGGVAWLDTDLDGRLDLFLTGGGYFSSDRQLMGHPAALFRQDPAQHFEKVTHAAGLSDSHFYSHGVASADYDHDGFPDLLVTGFGGIRFFHNQGDGTFSECAQSKGLMDDRWSTSAGWGDLNNDGNLDLYVAHYLKWDWSSHHTCLSSTPGVVDVCSPTEFESEGHFVFLSQGDGSFREVSSSLGLRTIGKGLGVVIGDVDLDGDVDVYVGNDTTENFLYVNDGHGHLTEVGGPSGVDVDDHGVMNGSMGVDLGDFDNDGLPDIWVTNYLWESFALYRNLGQQQFQHRSQALGISASAGLNVGWGTGFVDLDRDGDEDLFTTTGHVLFHSPPDRQVPIVLRNESGKRFTRVSFPPESYLGQPHHGRGLAFADYDNDGDLDVAISHNNEPASILRNDITSTGDWLQVRLVGRSSNRDAIGAWLVLHTSKGSQLRMIKGGGSYLSHSDRRVFWGIPAGERVFRLEIHWPLGGRQVIDTPTTNQTLTVIEH